MASTKPNPAGLVMRWAFRQPKIHPNLSSNAVLTLLNLADRWNAEEGAAWPSHRDLEERSHLSPRSIKRATAELELRGIIRKQPRVSRSGRKLGNAYLLNVDIEQERLFESDLNQAKRDPDAEAEAELWSKLQDDAAADLAECIRHMTPAELGSNHDRLAELRDPTYMAVIGPFMVNAA